MTTVPPVSGQVAGPHLLSDEESITLGMRAEALRIFRANASRHSLEGGRTMVGSLHRLATVFSAGTLNEHTFPWESLVDEQLTDELWRTVGQQYARRTAVKDASALRQMLKACRDVGLLTHEEYTYAKSFKTKGVGTEREAAGTYLDDTDVAALVNACATGRGRPATRIRDTALVLTLACSAARGDEITGVRLRDLHLDEHRILLPRTKNGQPRSAWLHPHATTALRRWIGVRGLRPGPLFLPLASNGHPMHDHHELSTFQVWKTIRARAMEAGLTDAVTPHDLRRYVISALLDHCDLALVAKVVGHANPATTVLYDKRPAKAQRAAVATLPLPAIATHT